MKSMSGQIKKSNAVKTVDIGGTIDSVYFNTVGIIIFWHLYENALTKHVAHYNNIRSSLGKGQEGNKSNHFKPFSVLIMRALILKAKPTDAKISLDIM